MPDKGKRKVQVIDAIPKTQLQKRVRQQQSSSNRHDAVGPRHSSYARADVDLSADDIPGPKGAGQGSAKGPTTKRPAVRSAGIIGQTSLERLEREVLGGQLWHDACRHACNPTNDQPLPVFFSGGASYINAYEPLLFDEGRAAIISSFQEFASKTMSVDILSVEERDSGWVLVKASIDTPTADFAPPKPDPRLNKHSAANARASNSRATPPPYAGNPDSSKPTVTVSVAAIVRAGASQTDRWSNECHLALFPACSAHLAKREGAPCWQAVRKLMESQQGWQAVSAGPITTAAREFAALHKIGEMPVMASAIQPQEAQGALRQELDAQEVSRRWPQEASKPGFLHHLRTQFDHTQLQAIEVTAAHLGSSMAPPPDQVQNPPQDAPAATPFTLIQGPPGTGKTHTVTGVLNTWHLVAFQRYHHPLVEILKAEALAGEQEDMEDISMRGFAEACERRIAGQLAAHKPRILVCAHSNAAADELLQRVKNQGFMDGEGRRYRPAVVRIGSDDAPMQATVKEVFVEEMARFFTEQVQADEWHALRAAKQRQIVESSLRLAVLQANLRSVHQSGKDTGATEAELAACHNGRDRLVVEVQRLDEVAYRFNATGGSFNAKLARENLEASFVAEAEMVFTTLSGTGRRILEAHGVRFDTVLVDEAAQASELATLQAFAFGCRRAVLVGDPQQLPATVLSSRAREGLLERSLFERLQKMGHPARMLAVQYRMHPDIRAFPSAYFYQNALQDAPIVTRAPPEPFYKVPLLQPYRFFDVTGRHQGMGRSKSLYNDEEAQMVVALFKEVCAYLRTHPRAPGQHDITIGIITFYRGQMEHLRASLRSFDPIAAEHMPVATVDSFQGQQLDIIILSCVRCSPNAAAAAPAPATPANAAEPGERAQGGAIGFLKDVRRINVAITRARRALWIVGNAATLRGGSAVWDALLQDARGRGCVVPNASVRSLFPQQLKQQQV
ncbi:hypothetical protein WJX73_008484 [Symbiochloris irregularis]|uniref:Uncharacterized protein n=1 Tax=Symbiochloris irregularis TaxID=706552 RepID=A0AAW1PRV0_9CHLO